MVSTSRLQVATLEEGDPEKPVVILLHGNVPSSVFWRDTMQYAILHPENLCGLILISPLSPYGFYPGGFVPSKNWPGTASSEDGIANAMSPKYVNLAGMAEVHKLFPILWVRGNGDQIVSDLSMFDLGTLGKLGLVPGWPGDDVKVHHDILRNGFISQFPSKGGRCT
jgi:pimeloyl-ACP methyl ester carboxylesterase